MSSPSSIRFDVFELRPDSNELFKGGSKLKLKPQAARVLSILARRPGEAVHREEIRGALWGSDTFVDPRLEPRELVGKLGLEAD